MRNAQYENITLKERNDTEKGNFKLNFQKQFCQIYYSANYFPGKVAEVRSFNTAVDCTCMECSTVAMQLIMSLSLLASVITAKGVEYLLPIYLLL